jgi:hypothetical protein
MSAGMFLGRLEFVVILVTLVKLGRDFQQAVRFSSIRRV